MHEITTRLIIVLERSTSCFYKERTVSTRICKGKISFYKEEEGLSHHFRIVHGKPITNKELREAKILLKFLHRKETFKCVKKFSDMQRVSQVINSFY